MKRIASNMDELKAMILEEVKQSMYEISNKALNDMKTEIEGFYTYQQPKLYERTGAMKETPTVTPISTQSLSPTNGIVTFEAYLDMNHRYTSGSNPTMHKVLEVAENHRESSYYKLRPMVGRQGFWIRSKNKIEKDINTTLGKKFKIIRANKK